MRTRSRLSGVVAATLAGSGLVLMLGAAAPALAADGAAPATVPCSEVANAILQAKGQLRTGVAIQAIDRDCHPLPGIVVSALRTGKWSDGETMALNDRSTVLVQATGRKYAEAETLAVQVLETGNWPDGQTLRVDLGAGIIGALKANLTPYRAHLLLDVYEQVTDPMVRIVTLRTLRASKLPEAILPALDAAYEPAGPLHDEGLTTVGQQPDKLLPEVHAHLLRTLPAGPFLAWATRLAEDHPSPIVDAAKAEREKKQ